MTITRQPTQEPDKHGFVGVSPEYANAANDTDLPYRVTEEKDDEAPADEPEESVSSSSGGSTPPPSTTPPPPPGR